MKNARLIQLVQAYQKRYEQYNNSKYNETELRNDFINPFFEILGWDIFNKKELPQYLREVKHEASVYVEEEGKNKKKRPDYAFYLGAETRFFLETKKPSVDITKNKNAAFQLRRYGWNGNLKISLLSNFTDLIIYDTTIQPDEKDEVSKAMIAHYHYTEYIHKFDEIARLISYASIISGEFDTIFRETSDSLKKETFDRYFLSQITKWRYSLGKDIFYNNPNLDEESLNILVQRLINRIVFLRICEDRDLEKYGTIKSITSYAELRKKFEIADKKYNSGLFDLIDEESIQISDELLIRIFEELYYPNSCYDFSIVDPYIIGQIYELFLEEKIIIHDNNVIIERKTEIVDSHGIVSTPKNMTDIIVQQTLNPLYEYEKFSQWGSYRIADICCGSGNFLLSIFEYIINHYLEYYIKHDKDNAVQDNKIIPIGKESYILSFEQKCNILKNNIFGVDIDELATEVVKFSLLLKLIEENSLNEMEEYSILNHCGILPNLDGNVRNGNSLVDKKYLLFNQEFYKEVGLISKIKLFDWQTEFEGRKFDAIVGNPPYIRVQNIVHYSTSEYEYIKSNISKFETAKSELLDKYYLFVERGLELLSDKGRLGYIVPHKFMVIQSGGILRKILAEKKCVEEIIHFGTEQVFKGRNTYTCLLFLSKNKKKEFRIGFVKNLKEYYATGKIELQKYPIGYLGNAPWNFLSEDIIRVLEQTKEKCQPLREMADIFVGLQTSADQIYIIQPEYEENHLTYFRDYKGKMQCIETKILRPCIYDISLEKYVEIKANKMLIFPYYVIEGKVKLYSLDEMEKYFPRAMAYFKEFKQELDKRSIKNRTDNNWYQFGRSQSLKRFSGGQHLLWSVLSTEGNYVYDENCICFTGGGNGPFYGLEKKWDVRESIYYIQAIMNYWLLEQVVKSNSSTFQGDYYSHGKQFIAELPIYRIDFQNCLEVKKHDEVVECVMNLMDLKRQRDAQITKVQREVYIRLISIENQRLEQLITSLYRADMIERKKIDEE